MVLRLKSAFHTITPERRSIIRHLTSRLELLDVLCQRSLERPVDKATIKVRPSTGFKPIDPTSALLTIAIAGNPLPFPIEANETRRSETTTFTMYPGPKPPTPHVPGVYRFTATALGAGMWFFLMYRAKKDGPVLLGWKHPWDH
ncbi:hypothetical protein CH63R_04479 [Colletotrichum higginsianum IMI 349063]|uniref:Uncharacterized protein n=4 Tax=Colletotrichum TaxID=5455 RepID=A0A1B7YJD0_COLHI|nr:hypothetical protein CH63R_04479 [Colletotrichum higginsianum IMI 349063]OBR12183.1 hypothetical protein CH63R_04479 [Colletotrichum higginsianum IMI 349063]